MRFDFNEINILMQNLYHEKQRKSDFLNLLRVVQANTEDHLLKDSLQSLIKKITMLSQQEFSSLYDDIINKRVIATMNRSLPFDSTSTK